MAGKGTYAAYGQLKGLGTQFTDNLRQAEQAGFQYREEDRKAKEKKDANRKAISQQLGVDMKDLKFKNTGIQSVDKPVYEYFIRTKGEIADLAAKMAADDSDIDSALKYQRIMNSAQTLSEFTKAYGTYQQDLQKGLAEGEYSEYLNKGAAEKINNSLSQGKYKIIHDKNGELNLFMDGDSPEDETLAINIPGFLNGNLGAPKARTNISDVVEGLSENYGTADIKDESGFVTERAKGFDPNNVEKLRKDVDQIMGSSLSEMTNAAKSAIADDLGANPDIMTEAQFKEFKQDIADNVVSRYDRVEETDIDQGGILSREKFNYEKGRDAKKDAKEEEAENSNGSNQIELIKNEKGIYKTETGASRFSLPSVVKVGAATAQYFQLNSKGALSISGTMEVPDQDGTGKVTQSFVEKSDTEITKFARQTKNPETGVNFRNNEELVDYLKKVRKNTDKLDKEQKEGFGNIDELPEL